MLVFLMLLGSLSWHAMPQEMFPVVELDMARVTTVFEGASTADDVKRRLLQLPGIASVGIAGDRDWEIWVEVDPQVLSARGVSLQQLIAAVRTNLHDLPGGSLKAKEGDILLRGKGVAPDPQLLRQVVIRSNDKSGRLRVGDVAELSLRLEEAETLGRFNGAPSVNLTVTKTADASTIEVSRLVREAADKLRRELPPSIQVGLFSDLSVYVKTRLNTVKSSGLLGLVLVLLSLYLFLNFRVALITAMGIPVSFLVAVSLIYYLGFTINMISLFVSLIGFLALTGIVVNDSLILVDFAKRLREQGWDRVDALVEAGRVRVRPILLTTVTTFLGISPLIFFASGQTAFLSPMAVSLGFGLLFATALILVAVPCFYLIADDLRQRVSGWVRRAAGHPARRV
jgi:multidrug efflux pump subunit AcrB